MHRNLVPLLALAFVPRADAQTVVQVGVPIPVPVLGVRDVAIGDVIGSGSTSLINFLTLAAPPAGTPPPLAVIGWTTLPAGTIPTDGLIGGVGGLDLAVATSNNMLTVV